MKPRAAIADLFGEAPVEDHDLNDDAINAPPNTRRSLAPATPSAATLELAATLPAGLHLGTSSWSFPGWQHLVYSASHSEVDLSRRGLEAYAAHPLLRAVSIDRTFYAPLSAKQFAAYAKQVPDDFRFIVKAPSTITAPWLFGTPGTQPMANPDFLSVELAARDFFVPAQTGLADKIGALVLQFSPVGRSASKAAARFAERLDQFLTTITPHVSPALIACELRDTPLLTPAYFSVLAAHGARHCIGVHPRMPAPTNQAEMAQAAGVGGPLIARWNLHAGYGYEEAKAQYAPFDKVVDEDLPTRCALATLAAQTLGSGQPVYITINNKAEGCAPLSVAALAEAIRVRLPST